MEALRHWSVRHARALSRLYATCKRFAPRRTLWVEIRLLSNANSAIPKALTFFVIVESSRMEHAAIVPDCYAP